MSAALSSPAPEGVDLVGTFHRFGEAGPAYEVLSIAGEGQVRIMVLESGETLDYPVAEVREDPRA